MKILFVCLGNICRSPMAETILKDMAKKRGLTAEIASAATSNEEQGHPVYYRAQEKLAKEGIACENRRARRMTKQDYQHYDLLVGMDESNIRNMKLIAGGDPEGKIRKLLTLCGEKGDVADPWFTGNFDAAYADITRGCRALCDWMQQERRRDKE